MELYQKVLIGVLVIVVFYLLIYVLYNKSSNLTNTTLNAKEVKVVKGNTLSSNNTNNYTYSAWIYIDDWNYRYGQKKTILSRLLTGGTPSPSPSIVLGGTDNDLTISVTCFDDKPSTTTTASTTTTPSTTTPTVHECVIKNIPIQKWSCIIVSLYGRTLDVYLEGKLVRTCLLKGVPKIADSNSDINITPDGGFSGFTSNIQYLNVATNPQQAYNIYKEGMGGSLLGDVMNKYKLKVSFLENDKETSSFQT